MNSTILLVEDEKKLADTIKAGLKENNYDVDIAYNGLEGQELFLLLSVLLVMAAILRLVRLSRSRLAKLLSSKLERNLLKRSLVLRKLRSNQSDTFAKRRLYIKTVTASFYFPPQRQLLLVVILTLHPWNLSLTSSTRHPGAKKSCKSRTE